MKIKIIKSSKPSYWYASRIEYEFEVSGVGKEHYYIKQEGKEICFLVNTDDAQIVHEERSLIELYEGETFP